MRMPSFILIMLLACLTGRFPLDWYSAVGGRQHMNERLKIDLMDVEVQKCPYDAYATLRQECPVYQMPSTGQYLVTLHDDLREVLRQPDLFSNQMPLAKRRPGGPNPDVAAVYRDTGWEPTTTRFC